MSPITRALLGYRVSLLNALPLKLLGQCVYLFVFGALALAANMALAVEPQPAGALALVPHHAAATVENIERAVVWYRDVLGFTVVERGERGPSKIPYAELKIPGYGIGLVQFPGTKRPDNEERPNHPVWLHIVFSVTQIAEAKRVLEKRGATVHANERDGRIQSLLLKDSEGNEIEIVPATP